MESSENALPARGAFFSSRNFFGGGNFFTKSNFVNAFLQLRCYYLTVDYSPHWNFVNSGDLKWSINAMFPNASVVEPKVARELIAAGSVSNARVEAIPGGLVILLQIGLTTRTLGVSRGGLRLFQSLDGVASALQGYGIEDFTVNTHNWVPKTMARLKAAAIAEPASKH